MPDTVIQLNADQPERAACGHRSSTPNCLPVNGGDLLTKTTIEDMSVWLAFNMGFMPDSLLADLVPVVHDVRYSGGPVRGQRLQRCDAYPDRRGWFIDNTVPGVGTLLFKDGGTLWFNSFIGFFPEARTGVMAMVNHTQTHLVPFGRELLCMITPGCQTD